MKDHNIEVFDDKKAVLFKNWTDMKFSYYGDHGVIQDENCRWGGVPHSFAPGESKFFPEGIAHHFAKHLTTKVLLKQGKPTDDHTRPQLYARCFAEGEVTAASAKDLEFELMNLKPADFAVTTTESTESITIPVEDLSSATETVEVKVRNKGGRPKKDKPNFN